MPLVDALMRELAATGFMANRGRGLSESLVVVTFINLSKMLSLLNFAEATLLRHT